MTMPDVAEITHISVVHVDRPIDNSQFASQEDLKRQSAYFADVFMTRHLLDVMPESGIRFTLSLPRSLSDNT